ncbi:MAG: hypothetical protein LBC20_02895 [Planctomycetaceae bacterium]|jgi:hypothetical protein|nr:hypothetical protein [Planctomycetaceae bacterium]
MNSRKFQNIIFILGIILLTVLFLGLFIFRIDSNNYGDLSSVQLIQKVVTNSDIDAFITLIKHNGIPIPKGNIKLGKQNPSLISDECCVNRAQKIYSDSNEFYVIIITQSGYYNGFHLEHQRLFVFNENGICIHDSGEFKENEKSLSYNVSALTLGSEKFWFIFESTTSRERQLPRKLHVFLVSSTMPEILVIDCQINSFSYTVTPDQTKENGVRLSFNLPNPQSFFVDKDGKKIKPSFFWKENERNFYGHKEAFVDGHLWFRVNVEKSPRFIDILTE